MAGFDNPKAKEMVIAINDVVGVKELFLIFISKTFFLQKLCYNLIRMVRYIPFGTRRKR